MKEKIIHYIKEIVLFIVVMTIFANIVSLYKSSDLNKSSFNLEHITLLDASSYKLDDTKPVLVHFWATWCPTCKLEASNIDTISDSFQVLTIAVKSGTNQDINNFLKENDLNFKVVNDNNGLIANEYNLAAYPTTLIYDKNREVVFSEVGYTSTFGLYLRMWWAEL